MRNERDANEALRAACRIVVFEDGTGRWQYAPERLVGAIRKWADGRQGFDTREEARRAAMRDPTVRAAGLDVLG